MATRGAIVTITNRGLKTEVTIDGHKLHNIRSIDFHQDALSLPVLTVDLNVFQLNMDSDCPVFQNGIDNEIESIKFRGFPDEVVFTKSDAHTQP